MNELGNGPWDKNYKPSGISKAEEAALEAYPDSTRDELGILTFWGYSQRYRDCFIEGYEQAEKDMKERFIQFVHSHYPINYIGWIQDFQRAMEDEK